LFGKNEFGVVPLFQESVESPTGCPSVYRAPYNVPDSALVKLGWNRSDSITLVIFDDRDHDNRVKKHSQVERITKEFETEKLRVFCLVENGETQWLNNVAERLSVIQLSAEELSSTKNCVFLLKESDNAVIIDSKKRIRGQYNLHDLDDADRLYVHELNILFKRY
jgi:hypothetical protein